MSTHPTSAAALALGLVQCSLGDTLERNLARVSDHVRAAAARGARVVLTPELLEGPYFPQHEREAHFDLARPLHESEAVRRFSELSRELEVVLPVSFFEREGPHYYNSVAMLDADGRCLGIYRKSHIPDGPGYEEKFFFRPGDTGFRAWRTRYGCIGVGICWDQWFPECARAMALQGAELLLYPTAIGSEPQDPELDTREMWRRVMIGHAVANAVPVAAANRIGHEDAIRFYGSSFVCDERGDLVAELGRDDESVRVQTLDLERARRHRAAFGFFRDRRPELYTEKGGG